MIAVHGTGGALLGYVCRARELGHGRHDVCAPADSLQVAAKREDEGRPSRAHRHLPQERTTRGTQEAWIVVAGSLRVIVREDSYGVARTFDLYAGDCYVSLGGVHCIEVLAADTLFYEVKNGPYLGRTADKEWIE